MNNKICIENKHQYQLWNIDKDQNIAWRVCSKCKFRRELPITEEICMEVVKQEEAAKLFKAFQLIDNYDENIVNYLNLILDDYINHLDNKSLRALINRMNELDKLDIVNMQDILYNNQLETYFEVENIETNNDIFVTIDLSSELNVDSLEKN